MARGVDCVGHPEKRASCAGVRRRRRRAAAAAGGLCWGWDCCLQRRVAFCLPQAWACSGLARPLRRSSLCVCSRASACKHRTVARLTRTGSRLQSVKAKVADAYIDHKLEKTKSQILGQPAPAKVGVCGSVCGCGKARK